MLDDTQAAAYRCDLASLDALQRNRRARLASEVWPQSLETRELHNGYEFRFDFSPLLFSNMAELAVLEHLCCPFFEITLKLDKGNGPIWLQITGDSGVKAFIEAEMKL